MIIFLILIVIIWSISKSNEKIRLWKEKIIQQPFNYYVLIGLLIVGFFFRLDYSNRYGCIVGIEPISESKNILFSAISITLVLWSFFAKKRTIKLTFISLELLFWLFKLSLFKGGYAVGYAAMPDPFISFYDTATLAFRLFIINSLLKVSVNQIYLLICTTIIMSVKIYIYPAPYSFYAEQRKFQLEDINTRIFLTEGKWIGNKDTKEKIQIIFFPGNVVICNLQNNDTLLFNQIHWMKGHVILRSWENLKEDYCIFEYQEKGKDTLNVNFKYHDKNYKTQMIRNFQRMDN